MKLTNLLRKRGAKITAALLAAALVVVAVASAAYFTDRETTRITFTTATFSQDGYTFKTVHPNGPFVANEDVTVDITEKNDKNASVNSTTTMTVTWTSPDPDCFIFGSDNAAENAVIKVGETEIPAEDITVSQDRKSITFDLPVHELAAGANQTRQLSLHIPDSLMGTGELSFTYDKVFLQQGDAGFTREILNEELNSDTPKHDFTVKVGWAASAIADDNGKSLMGYLRDDEADGEYEIYFEFPFDDVTESAMKDFAADALPRWSHYKDSATKLTLIEGMTTIGDYAFADFEQITELTLPESLTAVGAWSFDNISIPDLTIPAGVVTFEEMSFGHINELTEITFEHEADTEIAFPTAGAATGAFYVDPYVPTTILGANGDAQGYDWVTDQRRVNPVIRSYNYTWGDDAVDPEAYIGGYVAEQVDFHADEYRNTVTSVVFEGADVYYAEDNYAAISAMKESGEDTYTNGDIIYWNVTDEASVTENPNAAYSVIAALDSTTGELIIMGAGTTVLANPNSNYLFGLFENVETIDATKYDTRLATTMECWHVFNDPPLPEPGEPDYDDIQVAYLGVREIIGEENWDMSNVTSIADMFHNAKNLESISVSDWNTGSLVYANGAFLGCGKLTEIDVAGWDMADVVDLRATFARCEGLTYLPIEDWDVSNVQNLDMTFSRIMGVESLDLSGWDTSGLSGWDALNQTFQDSGFKSLNLTGWDISNVIDMNRTFWGTSNLTSLDLHTWDTSAIESMNGVFYGSGIKTINVTGWDFSSCTAATDVFAYCANLTDIVGEETWATTLGSVGTFEAMFQGCEVLQSVDVADWDVSGAKYGLKNMFNGCKALTEIPVSDWDVTVARTFEGIFQDCENLTDDGLDITGWNMSGVGTTTSRVKNMFNGCRSLTKVIFPAQINFFTYGMAANCPKVETIEFLSTSDTYLSYCSAGYISETSVGAFYVSDEDAEARYPANGKIPTTFVTHGAGMAGLTEGIYVFGKDNRSVPGAENMLMYGSTWYQGTTLRNTYTGITVSLDEADAPATYDEAWDASVNQDGSIMVYRVGTKLYMIGANGEIYLNPNSTNAFGSMSGTTQFNQATSFEGLDLFNASKLKNATNMFAYFASAEELDVSTWDTSNLEILDCTFAGCAALKHLDLTNWSDASLTKYSVPFSSGTYIEEVTVGADITNFSLFKMRGLTSASKLNFLHGPDAVINLPDQGTSGAFFVTTRMDTTVVTDNRTFKDYDWYTVRRNVTFISTPDSVTVTTGPAKTEYIVGETFDPTGMELTVNYIDGTTKTITDGFTVEDGDSGLSAGQTNVTISYEENGETKTTTVSITVRNPVTDITATAQPNKTSYLPGEEFDPTGIEITATYADGTTKVVTDYEIINGTNLAPGQTEVTISYTAGGATETITVPITVSNPVAAIEITTHPNKTSYLPGDEFDPTGIEITATYADGTTKVVTDYEIVNGTNLTAGQTSVTISYSSGGATETIDIPITVIAALPDGAVDGWDISAAGDRSVMAYAFPDAENDGKYTLTISGGGTMKNWEENSATDFHSETYKTNITSVTVEDSVTGLGAYAFNGFTSLTSLDLGDGIQTIGASAVASCTGMSSVVIPASVTAIDSSAFSGCSSLTTIKFLHGINAEPNLPNPGAAEGAFYVDTRTATTVIVDNAAIKEDYGWYDDQRDVTFISTPDSVAVTTGPAKTEYVAGENFDPTGIEITVTYIDGTSGTITDGFEVENGSPLAAGQTEVTITYTENGETKTTTVTIVVKNPATKIEVTTPPDKTSYNVGDTFDPTGMELTVTYADGSTKVITSGFTIESDDYISDAGMTDVLISYTENGATVTVWVSFTVAKSTATALEVKTSPNKTVYVVGETFDPTGLELTVTYEDGTTATITDGFVIESEEVMEIDTTGVLLSYTENGTTVLVDVPVTVVNLAVTALEVTKHPDKTTYAPGDTFDPTGMELTVTYTTGATKVITSGYEFEGDTTLTEGQTSIPISYTEDGETVFVSVPVIIIPADAEDVWTDIAKPGEGEITAYVADDTLYIAGWGAMKDYKENDATRPWNQGPDGIWDITISRIVILDGITRIGDYTFKNIESTFSGPYGISHVTDVIIADSVTWIGYSAFENAINSYTNYSYDDGGNATSESEPIVGNLYLPTGLTYIDHYAFKNCEFTSITFEGKDLRYIGKHAFYNCLSDYTIYGPYYEATTITFNVPENQTIYIDPEAFYLVRGSSLDVEIYAVNTSVLAYDWASDNINPTFWFIDITALDVSFDPETGSLGGVVATE